MEKEKVFELKMEKVKTAIDYLTEQLKLVSESYERQLSIASRYECLVVMRFLENSIKAQENILEDLKLNKGFREISDMIKKVI